MIPSTWPHYREALARPHKIHRRVEVWRAGIQVEELTAIRADNSPYTRDRPAYSTASVRATYGSRVTRVLELTVPERFFPWADDDLLAPYGNELRAWYGIEYGDSSLDEFPVFRGLITKPMRPSGGRFQLQAADRAYSVVKAGFSAPQQASVGVPIVDEIERLILEAVPDAEFGTHDTFTELVPPLAYDDDRGAALDNLCKTAGAVWYCLADGRFVVRRAPWSSAPAQAPVELTDGPGGLIVSAFPDREVEGVYNRITCTSERPDGGPARWATAEDTDPASPTYVGGPFGVRATQVRVTGDATQDQLYRLAVALVSRSRARATSWQYTIVPDGALELGDLISSSYRDRVAQQYIAGFTLSMDTGGQMTVEGHDVFDTEVGA